jgi:membrane-bound ClpP family serine protease
MTAPKYTELILNIINQAILYFLLITVKFYTIVISLAFWTKLHFGSCHDIAEILLKLVLNTNQSINQSFRH